jgi:hypothetical protein
MRRCTPIVIVLTLCAGCAMLSATSGKPNAGARARITGEDPYTKHPAAATAEATPAAARQSPADAKGAALAANRPADTGDRRSSLAEQGASIDQFTTRGARDTAARARQASETGYSRAARDTTLWRVLGIAGAIVLAGILIFRPRRRDHDDDERGDENREAVPERDREPRTVETREVRRPTDDRERIGGRTAARELRV